MVKKRERTGEQERVRESERTLEGGEGEYERTRECQKGESDSKRVRENVRRGRVRV
jgi:hypothetical protein